MIIRTVEVSIKSRTLLIVWRIDTEEGLLRKKAISSLNKIYSIQIVKMNPMLVLFNPSYPIHQTTLIKTAVYFILSILIQPTYDTGLTYDARPVSSI